MEQKLRKKKDRKSDSRPKRNGEPCLEPLKGTEYPTLHKELKLKDVVKHITQMKRRWAGHMARTSNDRWTKIISEG